MTFHSFICHQFHSWKHQLKETKKKWPGTMMNLYSLFYVFQGGLLGFFCSLTQLSLRSFLTLSILLLTSLETGLFFCMWIWTNEFWKGLKVGLFIFALKVSQETRLLTSTDFKRLIIEFMQNLLNFWTVRLEQVALLYNKALLS